MEREIVALRDQAQELFKQALLHSDFREIARLMRRGQLLLDIASAIETPNTGEILGRTPWGHAA
jgi:hypothetical protein